MTNTDKPKRKPERKETVKARQAERRARLKQAAQIAGFKTIDKLAAAILGGDVTITKRQP